MSLSDDYFSVEVTDQEEQRDGSLNATAIAEYIRFNCCPRFFKLKIDQSSAFRPISPLLLGVGKKLEQKKVEELKGKASVYFDFTGYDPKHLRHWEQPVRKSMVELLNVIQAQFSTKKTSENTPVLLYQVPMCGNIGVWFVRGIADLIAIWPIEDGKLRIRIFELKSSWQEQTAHRIQVAIYVLLLTQQLGELASKVELEGGVIHRQTNIDKLDPKSLPTFKLGPLIQDVERLLSKNGELNRIRNKPLEEAEYQLSWRCDNCGYNECCITNAVEKESLALLNLSRGEQNSLAQHGIKRLEDLAKLKVVLDTTNLRPYEFKTIPARDEWAQKVQELSTDPIVGAKIDWLVERAQYMLGGIRPNSPNANKNRWMPWLVGTGYGSLPEDSPVAGADMALLYSPNSLIRIYIFVEWDYMLQVISMVSARVSCTRFKGEPLSVSHVIGKLSDDRNECLDEENRLMEEFFRDLTGAITKVANEIGSPDQAPIHLYFFSHQERDALMKAVCRSSLIGAKAVRDLLGLRQAIDQPMFSIIQDEIRNRKALRYHSPGLLPILEQATCFKHQDWQAKRKDGTTADLYRVFQQGFFSYTLPFKRNPDESIVFLHEFGAKNDGFYPAKARFGDQLPIEYFWGVKNRLESYQKEGSDNASFEKCKWCDHTRTRRITEEELNLMGSKICLALECIERSLIIRNRYLGKKPIEVPKISEFTLGAATLEKSCREFLDLEYFSKRQEMFQHYALLPYQRVASGRSLIFQCTSIETADDEFLVRGKLIYEGLGLPKADCIANACRIKGSDDSSSGDWMVVTELIRNGEGQFEEQHKHSPSEVEKSARAIVAKVDVKKQEIAVEVITWPRGKGSKYSAWHNLPTTDPKEAEESKYMQLFEAGRYYILDQLADDIISDRAAKCLDYADNNQLYCLLRDYLAGNTAHFHTPLSKDKALPFLTWAKNRHSPPKPEQTQFVEHIFGKEPIVMLQGPPGTGKTLTLQLAVLAYVAAHKPGSHCRVLMVAPTHKAIQEFVGKLSSYWSQYVSESGKDLKDLRIYRVLSSDTTTIKAPEKEVVYVNYNEDDENLKELSDCLTNQSTLTKGNSLTFPLVLCVTPPGLYGLMKKIGGSEPPWGEGIFDLLVVDEASMMRLPELILSAAFLAKNSQILVAGDHRQLPPIVAHNWEKEDRRTLEEMASFLSAMDFLRLLRNEDLGLERIKCRNTAEIPTERLCESHRCHKVVAEFLKEWVYEKDKIDFHSDQKETLAPMQPKTEGLGVALKPENVFVLVVHDEAQSFQANLAEAQILQALTQTVKAEQVGIITPHNAQKGLLKNLLSNGDGKIRVDTVERYQGGEADFIIISATVSDPDYVRTESEFLLNLNRINVAISRMKKKLVIVASRSIFEFMPGDARDYDKALLWRGISQTVGFTANGSPRWKGKLADFLGQPAPEVNIEVYAKTSE